MCDANDRICTEKEQVPAASPKYSDIYPEYPSLLQRIQKNNKHHI
jgi:hypothetical protein